MLASHRSDRLHNQHPHASCQTDDQTGDRRVNSKSQSCAPKHIRAESRGRSCSLNRAGYYPRHGAERYLQCQSAKERMSDADRCNPISGSPARDRRRQPGSRRGTRTSRASRQSGIASMFRPPGPLTLTVLPYPSVSPLPGFCSIPDAPKTARKGPGWFGTQTPAKGLQRATSRLQTGVLMRFRGRRVP